MNQIVDHNALSAIDSLAESPRHAVDEPALDILFRNARSQNGFTGEPVPADLLERAVELAKLGPTAANTSPFRVLFVATPEAKARLKPALSPGNVEKTMSAPVTAIAAGDAAFYEYLPRLFPHVDARAWYVGNAELAAKTALQGATLQAAYFMIALRALGLDAGPMGGFDNAKVDAEFFAGTTWKSTFLINIGYGDPAKLFPRLPRLAFSEIAAFA